MFLSSTETNEAVEDYIISLKDLNYTELLNGLKNDDDKKAFWINLYNAYTNSSLHKNPDQYKDRKAFFKQENIVVAGKIFSLDKIEHGILRRSKIKWSLGYFSKLFPKKTEKDLRVYKLDYLPLNFFLFFWEIILRNNPNSILFYCALKYHVQFYLS